MLAACLLACEAPRGGRERAAPSASDASARAPACVAVAPDACGDPCGDGVVVDADVEVNSVWDCPVYTLPAPVYVRGADGSSTRLVIAPGTVIKGRPGALEQGRLPGALIVTRSGQIDARGTREAPIVFTSSRPPGQRAPGDWGGVVLLGRAPTNVPANYQGSGNRAGEMYVEGLPPSADTTYGGGAAPAPAAGAPDAGAPLEPPAPPDVDAGPDADAGAPLPADPEHDCGTLRFVRIEFAGFEVGDTNELNGLTLGGCGRLTELDFIQVHLGADDGIELFGGTANLKHAVITGARDDALDWDQGWAGRAQFLAIRPARSDDAGDSDNGFEGDGLADADRPAGEPSSPVIWNVTLLGGPRSVRAIRLREGTRLVLGNALLAAPGGGPLEGLVDIGDVATADELRAGRIRIEHSLFQGAWPTRAQADSRGENVLAEDWFTIAPGAAGNGVLTSSELAELLPGAESESGWVPLRGGQASRDFAVPLDPEPARAVLDPSATYRGAFDPSGADWTQGWAAYPPR